MAGIAPPGAADGNALARTAMAAVRRMARAGGHPLPAHVPPATSSLDAIAAAGAAHGADEGGSPGIWLKGVVLASVLLLGALLCAVSVRAWKRAPG